MKKIYFIFILSFLFLSGQTSAAEIHPVLLGYIKRLESNDPELTNFAVPLRLDIRPRDVVAVAEALKRNTVLTQLNFLEKRIQDEGAIALAEALKQNATLKKLRLESCYVGTMGAIAFADALRTNTTLEELELPLNKIGYEGLKALSEALKINTSLKTLDVFSYVCLGREDFEVLLEALHKNATLMKLVCSHPTERDRRRLLDLLTPVTVEVRRQSLILASFFRGLYRLEQAGICPEIDSEVWCETLSNLESP